MKKVSFGGYTTPSFSSLAVSSSPCGTTLVVMTWICANFKLSSVQQAQIRPGLLGQGVGWLTWEEVFEESDPFSYRKDRRVIFTF